MTRMGWYWAVYWVSYDSGMVSCGAVMDITGLMGLAAYLLVFLLPTKPAFPLFPSHATPAQSDNDPRKASASTHQVYSLQDVHAIPLLPDLAPKSLAYLSKLEVRSRHTKFEGLSG